MALGLYVSRCGGKVDSTVDLEVAVMRAREVAAVVRIVDDFFDPQTQDRMVRDIADAKLDAIVIAGHSPEHYRRSLSGRHLQNKLVAAGVNPNRVVAANLLEQVAMVHQGDRAGATAKAAGVIEVACLRAVMGPQLEAIGTAPLQSVLILGLTTEALVAAQRLLQLGYSIVIAERSTAEPSSLMSGGAMRATAAYVLGHAKAELLQGASIVDGQGWLGDFEIALETSVGRVTRKAGGILLARPDVPEWIDELRRHFKVDIDEEGNARSIDPATHPAETVDPGIMVVPVRGGDSRVRDRVAVADSAVMALVLGLSQHETHHYHETSHVDEKLCGGCATCVRTCAFGACYIGDDGLSHVDIRRCRACGKCVVSCPVGARDIVTSPHDYLVGAIKSLAHVDIEGDKVLGFLCGGCGYPAGDAAAQLAEDGSDVYPASFLPLQIPCGGRLDTLYVLEAFKEGFDGVVVFRCREGHCHNLVGNLDMDRRVNLLRTVLRSRRLDDSRLRIIDISPFEGERFAEQVSEVFATLQGLTNGKGGPQ